MDVLDELSNCRNMNLGGCKQGGVHIRVIPLTEGGGVPPGRSLEKTPPAHESVSAGVLETHTHEKHASGCQGRGSISCVRPSWGLNCRGYEMITRLVAIQSRAAQGRERLLLAPWPTGIEVNEAMISHRLVSTESTVIPDKASRRRIWRPLAVHLPPIRPLFTSTFRITAFLPAAVTWDFSGNVETCTDSCRTR